MGGTYEAEVERQGGVFSATRAVNKTLLIDLQGPLDYFFQSEIFFFISRSHKSTER